MMLMGQNKATVFKTKTSSKTYTKCKKNKAHMDHHSNQKSLPC